MFTNLLRMYHAHGDVYSVRKVVCLYSLVYIGVEKLGVRVGCSPPIFTVTPIVIFSLQIFPDNIFSPPKVLAASYAPASIGYPNAKHLGCKKSMAK